MKTMTVLGLTGCAAAAVLATGALRGAPAMHRPATAGGAMPGQDITTTTQLVTAQVTTEVQRAAAGAAHTADAIDLSLGQQKFRETCATCHGPGGQGMPHQGVDLRTSTFIEKRNDDQLVDFLKIGRRPTDPESQLGLVMPPRGGNNKLDDAQLRSIVAYLRQVQREAAQEEPADPQGQTAVTAAGRLNPQ